MRATAVLVFVGVFTYACSVETHSDQNYDHLLDKINLLELQFVEFKKDVIAKELQQTTKIMVQENMSNIQDTDIANLRHTLSEQAVKTSVQESKIANLQAKLADQDITIANLRAATDLSASQISTLKAEKVCGCGRQCFGSNEITTKLDHLSDRVTVIENGEKWNNWTKKAIQDGEQTAFFVRMTEHTKTISATLVWNDVVTNLGNGYNSGNGIFTAPESGVYVFQWMILAFHKTDAYTELVVNDDIKIRNHAESLGGNLARSNTASAILTLDKGDKVQIRKYYGTLNIWGEMWSAFQGFKLK